MSEQAQGPGWWVASDGKWYAPELHPDATPTAGPAPTAASPQTPTPPPTGVASPAPVASPRSTALVVGAAVFVVLALLASAFLVARSRSDGGTTSAGSVSGPDELPGTDLTLGDQTVVVRGNGGATLQAINDDGRTLTLDARAEGADKLATGKVMLLTGITAVKVDKIERSGDSVVVTAAPVAITEVIKDGTLSWNEMTVKPGTVHIYLPEDGDFIDQGAASGSTKPPKSVRAAAARPISFPLGRVAGDIRPDVKVKGKLGGYDVELAYESGDDTTVKVSASRGAGSDAFTMEMTGEVKVKPFTTSGDIRVTNSTVDGLRYALSNLSGSISLSVKAGLVKGPTEVTVNKLKQLKIPAKIETPVVINGIPFILSYSASLQLEPIFPTTNATIEATAKVTFSGNAGVNFAGVTATPDSNVVPDSGNPLDAIKGVSLAAVAFTYTLKMRIGLGLGVQRVNTGVYAEFGTAAAANVAGTTMAAPCRQESIRFWVDMGADATFMGWSTDVARVKAADKTWKYYAPTSNICKI